MLQKILQKVDGIAASLKHLNQQFIEQDKQLAVMDQRLKNIETSIDGQITTRRWVVGTIIAVGALVGWPNLVLLWNAIARAIA